MIMILKPKHRRELKIALLLTAMNVLLFLYGVITHKPILYTVTFISALGFVLWLGSISDRLGKYN